MNILRIVYDWPPPWNGLGPAPYEMTQEQVKLGHSFTIFCGRWPFAGALEKLPNCKFKTFIREPFPASLSLLISPLVLFYYLYWRRHNKPDLIHAHGHFAIWIYFYRNLVTKIPFLKKEADIPLVTHFHNTTAGRREALIQRKSPIKKLSALISWPLAKKSDRWAIKNAKACIFVGQEIRNEAIKYYNADPAKCFVVETGVNIELFKPVSTEEREKIRKDLGFDSNDIIVMNHGQMVKRKNIHTLVEALEKLPIYYRLFLVGDGDKDYMLELDTKIKDLNLRDRVVRAGYTPYPNVPIAFQASDVFVLPSSFEGLPKVVMQSLACGIPALVSGFKVSEEIGGLSYLENIEPETIAASIRALVEVQKPQVDIRKIVKDHSWHEKAKEVERVYDFVKNTPQTPQ